MAINGQIVDEINGLIASRDSIRTTMLDASVAGVTNTSKLADLATKLSNAKLGATTYNVSASNQTISAGKLTTGAQTIRAVTTSGIEAANIKSGAVVKVGDAGSAGRIKNVTGTFTKEDNNPITAATVLSGKVGYVNGAKVTGNIPTVTPSTDKLNCGDSATIAKGYLASAVTITANSLASQTSGTAAAGDIRSGKTAWVAGKQVTGSMPNGGVSVDAAGTLTKQPSISRQSFTNISGITDAAADNATTTAPTSSSTYKAWVKVNSAANTASYTPSATKTAGYISEGTVKGTAGTYGAAASADTYIPIKTGDYSASVSITAGSASMSASGVSTTSSSNCYITLSTTAGSATGKATIGTAGWIATGSTSSSSASVNVNGNGTKLYLATYTPSTITVTNSSQTIPTSGKVCTGNITIPAVNYYYTSLEAPTSTSGYNDGDVWLVVNP